MPCVSVTDMVHSRCNRAALVVSCDADAGFAVKSVHAHDSLMHCWGGMWSVHTINTNLNSMLYEKALKYTFSLFNFKKCTQTHLHLGWSEDVSSSDLMKCSIASLVHKCMLFKWMGAVRIRVQTADKNITIIHTTPVHQLMSLLWTYNVLMLDLFQHLSPPDVNWWTGVVWIIVTAPIHCRASDGRLHFSKSDEETNSSASWTAWWGVNIQLFFWALPLNHSWYLLVRWQHRQRLPVHRWRHPNADWLLESVWPSEASCSVLEGSRWGRRPL